MPSTGSRNARALTLGMNNEKLPTRVCSWGSLPWKGVRRIGGYLTWIHVWIHTWKRSQLSDITKDILVLWVRRKTSFYGIIGWNMQNTKMPLPRGTVPEIFWCLFSVQPCLRTLCFAKKKDSVTADELKTKPHNYILGKKEGRVKKREKAKTGCLVIPYERFRYVGEYEGDSRQIIINCR